MLNRCIQTRIRYPTISVMTVRMEALMKRWKRILLVMLVALTVLSLLLSACGPMDNLNNGKDKDKNNDKNNNGNDDDQDDGPKADKIMICHKTGSKTNPYVLI